MRRIVLLIVVLLAAPASASARPTVELVGCEPDARAAEFEAVMDRVPGATWMKLRFVLQARKPGQRGFRRIDAPGFDEWTTAVAGTARYVFTRRVEELIGPARYRALVRFRWVGRGGRTIRSARAVSRSCRQRDHRPNLRVRALSIEGDDAYAVLVANTGRTETGPFELQLDVTGAPSVVAAAGTLEPGESRLLAIAGPACAPGARIVVRADPFDALDERNERDNARRTRCRRGS